MLNTGLRAHFSVNGKVALLFVLCIMVKRVAVFNEVRFHTASRLLMPRSGR